MKILIINTSTGTNEIALINGSQVIFEKNWKSAQNESEKLLPEIQKGLKKAKLGIEDLSGIAVTQGPGPFTSLRIGVATANALAISLKIPLYSLPTFQYIRAKIQKKYQAKSCIIMRAGTRWLMVPLSAKPNLKTQKYFENAEELHQWLKAQKKHLYYHLEGKVDPTVIKLINHKLTLLPKITYKSLAKTFKSEINTLRAQKTAVVPQYINKPHITQSKKPLFT